MLKMMLVPRKNYGPRANRIGNAPGPVNCSKCGKHTKHSKYSKYTVKCSKCAYRPRHTPLLPAVSRLAEKRARLTPAGVVLLCERGQAAILWEGPACGHQTGFSRLRRKLPRTAPESTPGCAGSYHEIVMAFRLPSAARPVSTPTTDKTTVPSAAGTTSSNTARYLSRPVPVHSFMP